MKLYIPELLTQFLDAREKKLSDQESETRFVQYTVICFTGIITMVVFGIYNYTIEEKYICLIVTCCAVGLSFGWYLLYQGKAQRFVYRGNTLLFSCLLLYMMFLGGKENSLILWMYISPLIMFFLLGRKEGAIWVSLMWFCVVLFFFGPIERLGFEEQRQGYGVQFSIRFIVTFSIISVITYFYENFRYLYRRDLEAKNKTLLVEIEQRKKAQQSLVESEQRYRAIYSQAAEGIFLITHEGVIVDCNPQILSMLAYTEEQLLGKNIFSLINKEDLEKIPPQLNRVIDGESILLERRILTGQGKYLLCEQSGKRINDDLILLLYRDITERKIAEVALERANRALDRLAHLDGLTQIANRRKFDAILAIEWKRMAREGKSLGLILADVDYFKQFNDLYGHQAGDECLRLVASILEALVHRPSDLVARYGGEEFVVMLPDTDAVGCMQIAEKMRAEVARVEMSHSGSKCGDYVTMSFGVGVAEPGSETGVEQLIARADKALYLAKEKGRNCVCQHEEKQLVTDSPVSNHQEHV